MSNGNEYASLDRSLDGSIETITMVSPGSDTDLRYGQLDAIESLLIEAEENRDAKVLVLQGDYDVSCDGIDPLGFAGVRIHSPATLRIDRIAQRIQNSRLVSLAAMNGAANHAGADLALACDLRIASEMASVEMRPFRPRVHTLGRFVSKLGRAHAAWMVLKSGRMNASDLFRTGFVGEIVVHSNLGSRTSEFAAEIARIPEPKLSPLLSGIRSEQPAIAV